MKNSYKLKFRIKKQEFEKYQNTEVIEHSFKAEVFLYFKSNNTWVKEGTLNQFEGFNLKIEPKS